MDTVQHRFTDLDVVVDHLHNLFDQWTANGFFPSLLEPEMIHRVRLAVHEWIANLVQHGDFQDRVPEIRINVQPNGQSIYCVIEDNSDGFDLNMNLQIREAMIERLPDRGMGLLMLRACTKNLTYRRTKAGFFRLSFTVSADQEPWLQIPF